METNIADKRFNGIRLQVDFNGTLRPEQQKSANAMMARLDAFLDGPGKKMGQIGGGKRNPTGKIDVATIQILNRKGVVDDIVAESARRFL